MSEEHAQTPEEERGLTAPVRADNAALAFGELVSSTGDYETVFVDNLPDDPVERYSLLSLATDGDTFRISEAIGETIELRYWVAHSVGIEDERSGEVASCPRVVLIDADGNAFAGVSSGLLQALRRLLEAFGLGDLPRGLRVKFKQISTRKGRRTFTFVPVSLGDS